MSYKTGDTVVCIDAKIILHPTGLVAGNEYVVHYTDGKNCTAVEGVFASAEQHHMGLGLWCAHCGARNPTHLAHFLPSRFIKLDPLMKAERVETSEPVAA